MEDRYQIDLQMIVLGILHDDIEDLSSIMLHIPSWRQYWPRDFTEAEIVVALRMLLEAGWIRALALGRSQTGHSELFEVEVAQTSEQVIRSYWFQPTKSGRDTWRRWEGHCQIKPFERRRR